MDNQKTLIHDLTEGSVARTLLYFSAPLLVSNLLQTLYNMIDMMVAEQFVGQLPLGYFLFISPQDGIPL